MEKDNVKQSQGKLKSIFSILLVLVMLFGMMPMTAFADGATPEKVNAEIYGHTNFFSDIDLFASNAAGEVADKSWKNDLLYSIEPDSGTYTVELAPGYYVAEGKKLVGSGDEATLKSIGTILVNITESNKEINLCAIMDIKASNSGWVRGVDYDVAVTVEDKDRNERVVTFSEEIEGKLSCLALEGDTVRAVYTPKDIHPDYVPTVKSSTYNANTSSHSASIPQSIMLSVSAPEGSTIDCGTLASSFVYTFYDPATTETENGKTISTFKVPKGTTPFYRVQNPSGVTYWDYVSVSTTTAINVSAEALHIGDSTFTKDTVIRDFSANKYDMANIYLGANAACYINLNSGESFELNNFRDWQAIEGISNAKIALPDMHYEVIDFEGNDTNDVITVTADSRNSNVANIRAIGEGTAVVLVTYDAMTHKIGYGGSKFSAIWPEFTGVLVVSVNKDGSSVSTNMTLDRLGTTSKTAIDAEHDIFFYTGDEGATYSFTPEAGAAVSVARPVVTDTLTFNGFSTDGITTDASGKVTITGLKNGRNIVKVEKGGVANYQVITARKVSYTMTDADGNPITDSNKPKAGDKVKIQFTGLVNPAEKLATAYNFNASIFYIGSEESSFKSNPGSNYGVYDFSGNPVRQNIEITIPKYFPGDTYNLTGCIKMGGFGGPLTVHRAITYERGKNANFTAPNVSMVLSSMPELSISLAPTTFLTGRLSFADNNGDAVARTALTITVKDADGNAVQVADDGTFKGVAETFSYEIAGDGYAMKTGTFEMTEDGANEFSIELTKLAAGAWNGSATTEPAKVGDVYQVTNGAEMAWVAQQSTKQDLKAKLVNDIELGGYPWINKETSSNKTFIFDGNGKTVSGLNATKGLFGAIGKDSVVKDLTVRGQSSGGGSIVGYINGTGAKVENCVSYVNIKSTDNNVGGIIGYAFNNTFVKRCVNYGSVEGKKGVGGIIGGFAGNCTVEECINYGEVKCTEANAGGIFGGTGYPAVIKNCYNEGSVSGTGAVGGIGGELSGNRDGNATVENCYSCGTVTGDASFGAFGSVGGKAVHTNNAYLATAGNADANAEALSEAELRSFNLGEAFTLACRRYPALTWETGITRHSPTGEPTVVAPGCLTKGYTVHTCANCGETYRDTYVAALGHQKGADAVDDGKKCTYTCERCHQAIVEWADSRFEFLTLGAPEITNLSFSNDAEYKWDWNKTRSRFESTNVGVDKNTATSTLNFTVVSAGALSFDYGVSSEARYDKMTIALKQGDTVIATVADAISGEVATSYAITLSPGAYSITLSYSKDSSSASGSDLGYIANLAFAAVSGGNTGGGSDPGTPEDDTIRVSMRLIGSELATQDVDLGANNYIPSYVTWIATTSYDMPKDSTVYDLWMKALQDAGLRSEGADNNYVSTVYAPSGYELSEMTNGPRSGWMYTINGKHPRLGLKEQALAAKDAVVWHYVNDYAYEVDDWTDDPKYPALGDGTYYNGWLRAADKVGATGGSPASTSNAKKAEEVKAEETPAPTVTTNVETQATVKDGKATASVKAADVTKAIEKVTEQAKEQAKTETAAKATEKEVVLAIKAEGNANAVEAKLPTEAVKELAKAEAKTVLQTECGSIEIPSESMSSIADQAAGKDISVTVETKKAAEVVENIGAEKLQQETGLDEKAVTEAVIVEVTINAGENAITSFGGKSIKLSLPVADKQEIGKTYKVIAISADGSIEVMTGVCIIKDGKKFVDVSSSHLTTFVVTTEEVNNPFSDVQSGDYFYAPVLWAIENNITSGKSADTFAPFESCTRAQMVTFLWRVAGKPWASANTHFSDVPEDAYYAEAVEWAIASGITKGIGETTFAPNDVVTREQLASFIYRYAVEKGKGYTEAPTAKLGFSDAGSVHAWADEAMHWCVEKGIVSGMDDKKLAPQNEANRAQIVTMLYRFSSVL